MNIGSTVSLYDEMEKSIGQEQTLEMSNLGNLAKLGSSIGSFIKGNTESLAEGGEGKGLFGKEGGFMSKFGTGEGWFSQIGKGEDQFMGKFGTWKGTLEETLFSKDWWKEGLSVKNPGHTPYIGTEGPENIFKNTPTNPLFKKDEDIVGIMNKQFQSLL